MVHPAAEIIAALRSSEEKGPGGRFLTPVPFSCPSDLDPPRLGEKPAENLKSSDNSELPFDTQCNDTFTLADRYQIFTGKNNSTPGVLNDGERRDLIGVLKTEDRQRRPAEARALLD